MKNKKTHYNATVKHNDFFLVSCFLCLASCLNAQTWTQVPGMNPNKFSWMGKICIYKNELYLSHSLDSIGGIRARFIARWNGVKWDTLIAGNKELGTQPSCLAVHNNQLYIGGTYAQNDSSTIVFSWDGVRWRKTGNFSNNDDIDNAHVFSMQSYKGELYVGGQFIQVGGKLCNNVTRWNGSNWNSAGGGVTLNLPMVYSMTVYKGELIVAGIFSKAGNINANSIARWNGTKWDSLGSGVNGSIGVVITDTINNVLYAVGGINKAGGKTVYGVAKWDGTDWYPVGTSIPVGGNDLCMYHGQLYSAGGGTVTYGTKTLRYICNWDGNTWDDAGGGVNAEVFSLCVYQDDLYAGGGFSECGGQNGIYWLAKYHTPVGVEEFEVQSSKFKVYPNPAKNEITIELTEQLPQATKLNLCLYDNLGKEVLCEAIANSQKQTINTSCLSKGFYLARLFDEKHNSLAVQKIVVE